jgi:small conductance mechanosensitive channel
VLILVIGWIVARIVTRIMRRLLDRSRVDPTLVSFLTSLTYIGLMAFIVIGALGKLGVQTASFVAVIGAAGLAIGFALQGSLANFAAGVMLILFRPFKAGDYVEAGGVAGSIEEVQMFATVFKTPDNRRIVVPNASITSGSITNYAAHDTRRVDLVFGIGYGDDISLAKQVLQEILQAEERVLKDPEPTIAVSELADSSVNFVVRPWVMTADYWGVYFDLTERVKLAFDARGISIPFPQRDVHMHQAA